MRGGRAVKLHILKPSETVRGSRPRGSSRGSKSRGYYAAAIVTRINMSRKCEASEDVADRRTKKEEEIWSRNRRGILPAARETPPRTTKRESRGAARYVQSRRIPQKKKENNGIKQLHVYATEDRNLPQEFRCFDRQ